MDIEKKLDIIINNFTELKKLAPQIQKTAEICANTLKSGNKILLCGNGGSAADSQHIAAELVVKYKKTRQGLPAISLTTDTSILTAVANDLGAEKIFERQVEALGNVGDVLIAISTSGNSKNVVNAIKKAKEKKIITIALTGQTGGKVKEIADCTLCVPSLVTNNIQEMHIAIGHLICDYIENA